MNVMIFGATGMVGQGCLRECLLDADVKTVLVVGRSRTGQRHAKLREIAVPDLFDLKSIEADLTGYSACFFCLGTSSAGMREDAYRKVTYDLTLSIANTLVNCNPSMTFVYVSGMSTDSTASGRVMWARVKGETENALLKLPFKAAYMFRPGFIQPLNGIVSKTRAYRLAYVFTSPLFPVLNALFPKFVTTTEQIGRAMLNVAREGAAKPVLESADIRALGAAHQ